MLLYPRMMYRVGKLSDCKPVSKHPGIFWSTAIDEAEEAAMVEKYGFFTTVAAAEASINAPETAAQPEEQQVVITPPKRRGRPPKAKPE